MKLRFNILGIDICAITLDIERAESPTVETIVEKVVTGTSKWWMKRVFG